MRERAALHDRAWHLALRARVQHGLPTNVVWFIAVAMVMSLANGIGKRESCMTLGADLADRAGSRAIPGRVAVHRRHRRVRPRPLVISVLTGIGVDLRSRARVHGSVRAASAPGCSGATCRATSRVRASARGSTPRKPRRLTADRAVEDGEAADAEETAGGHCWVNRRQPRPCVMSRSRPSLAVSATAAAPVAWSR